MTLFAKDPTATIDYSFDWSSWLTGGEAITATNWSVTPATNLSLGSEVISENTRGVFVSGGEPGERYRLSCQIETDAGRVAEQSATLRIMET